MDQFSANVEDLNPFLLPFPPENPQGKGGCMEKWAGILWGQCAVLWGKCSGGDGILSTCMVVLLAAALLVLFGCCTMPCRALQQAVNSHLAPL